MPKKAEAMIKKEPVTLFDKFLDDCEETTKAKLVQLRNDGLIAPITKHLAYRFEFALNWNRFVEAGPDNMETWQLKFLVGDVTRSFIKDIFGKRFELTRADDTLTEDSPELIKALEIEFQSLLDAGDMTKEYYSIEAHSPVAKGHFHLLFENWKPKFITRSLERGASQELPPIDVSPITHMEVDIPTGEMLLCDWMRIEQFTAALDTKEKFDISSASDRIERTIEGVRKFNVMEVKIGNGSGCIVVDRDAASGDITQIRIGDLSCDDETDEQINPSLETCGSITTDYHGATIVDRQDLKNILLATMDDAAAEAAINHLINEHPYQKPIVINIPPGKYHFYFVEYHLGDIWQMEHATDDLGTGMETILMLRKTPIDLPVEHTRHV